MFFENNFVQGHWMVFLKNDLKNNFALQVNKWRIGAFTIDTFPNGEKFSIFY